MTRTRAPFGFINALKPPGPTSTSFGVWVRRLFGGTPVGHWGTLDPAACGVLVLAIGRAARLLPYLAEARKRYAFELRLGAATNTGDSTGNVVASSDVPSDWQSRVTRAAAELIGPLDQVPPMYSAVKVQGRPLYKAARAGREVERMPRRVEIFRLNVLGFSDRAARLSVECAAGTFVRTLCEQIGERVGTRAHLGMLVRTGAGPFELADAKTPKEIQRDPAASLIDPLTIVELPRVVVGARDGERFVHGNAIRMIDAEFDGRSDSASGEFFVLQSGNLLGIGRAADGSIVPVRVLADAGENS